MFALETEGLTKRFGDFTAVDSLDLNVPEGSVYGFLGPNGAGKTTTIRMLTGLSKPSGGSIRLFGKEIRFGSVNNLEKLGYLPDVPSFYEWMTAEEYLRFSGELFGIRGSLLKDRIKELLGLVGLDGEKKHVGGYSRGMKQRLGIAQALINDPGIVLLDEPTSALDPVGRKEVLDIIRSLAGRTTVFFSTHILADIERVCDMVVIINRSRKVLEDNISNRRRMNTSDCIIVDVEQNNDSFSGLLSAQEWIDKIVPDVQNGFRIYVRDLKLAQISIPALVAANGYALKTFIIPEPTLEDIFLEAVKQ